MDYAREDFDNYVWDKNDEAWEDFRSWLRQPAAPRRARILVEQRFKKPATLVPPMIIGGYNILYRLRVEGVASDVLIRIPCPSFVKFAEEKTLREGATARFIRKHTRILVPEVFYYGQDSEVGPFIILQYIENRSTWSYALRAPNNDPNETYVLNPNVSERMLEDLCSKVASCILQLSEHTFTRIGSLVETQDTDGSSFSIAGRPITQNMNNMIQLANIPRSVLPAEDKTYDTADEWYVALAEMHISQLVFQHNDMVSSPEDCRNKYVARHLLLQLAKKGLLSTFGFAEDDWSAQSKTHPEILCPGLAPGEFRLWCDDFRGGNVLLNDSDDIVACIDWEFAYAAPSQFMLDPPWWLLLEVPEMWGSGIDDWSQIYQMRLKTWLSAMEKAEEDVESNSNSNSLPFPLSTYMRESWETGRFWLSYAARKSWAFDTIFWKYLDERFFGGRADVPKHELWKTRLHFLGEKERCAMEPFVKKKMEESKERIIVDWDLEEAKERLGEVLFS
ncbi:hypothetical protein LHYA1_G008873 [Lachnellula hyalina]|uniref:Aminoglycoside phosphotransferase domain-containing protein n=1 Tax=Lachnellula hyalina TaxID=1316788 RepID=A0A8H8QTC3_9HELO|nr:uncharacterized protein LHYA1_G008873 [Lachnellula hyalina]TVY22293.1 hypothetical protein LHYA1_G008873 [Lachnellula hyalina]